MMMEAICSYRTLVKFHQTTWRYITEHNSEKLRCEIFASSTSVEILFDLWVNALIFVNNVASEGIVAGNI
jgi:hypothetical protein